MKKIFLIIIIFLTGCTTPIGGAKKVEDIKPKETPSIETIEAGLWMQMNNYEEKLKTSGSRIKDKNLEKYLKNILLLQLFQIKKESMVLSKRKI